MNVWMDEASADGVHNGKQHQLILGCELAIECMHGGVYDVGRILFDRASLENLASVKHDQIRFNNLATLMIHSDKNFDWTTFASRNNNRN